MAQITAHPTFYPAASLTRGRGFMARSIDMAFLRTRILVPLVWVIACKSDPGETTTQVSSTTSGDSATTEPVVPGTTTTSGTTDEPTPTTSADTNFPNGDIPDGGQCNLFAQDCMAGQKCNAWNEDGGIFPNGAKCTPIMGERLPGEGCTLEGNFGAGVDDCAEGSICLDIDNSGKAACVAYCQGNMDDPTCPEVGDKCAFLFEPTVPLCFPSCDPLVQDCSPVETCVPNIAALGAEFFVCMPRVFEELPGQYGDACYALSGCDPSYLCIFAENVPGCDGTYCCSTYCDLTAPETCTNFDPTLSCIPWYQAGDETPGYENVGVCGVMP